MSHGVMLSSPAIYLSYNFFNAFFFSFFPSLHSVSMTFVWSTLWQIVGGCFATYTPILLNCIGLMLTWGLCCWLGHTSRTIQLHINVGSQPKTFRWQVHVGSQPETLPVTSCTWVVNLCDETFCVVPAHTTPKMKVWLHTKPPANTPPWQGYGWILDCNSTSTFKYN